MTLIIETRIVQNYTFLIKPVSINSYGECTS